MKMKQLLWCSVYLAALLAHVAGESCLVTKNQRSVLGVQMTSRSGRSFCSFRGIQYATAQRFKTPESVDLWAKDWNATKDGPQCMQSSNLNGLEDCLYLNVYSPQNTFPSPQQLPVIVYLHGGAFYQGSGVSSMYNPKYYMDKDVVLVTINYRLGLLGFISTGDDEAPGNFGLKDQVAALRWVRDNVADFGGNPNKVTLQGQSAGAQSVNCHMFSPLSKGLFHAAIGESGSAFKANMIPLADPLALAKQQGALVNCPVDNSSVLISCLRNMDGASLVKKQISGGVFRPVTETRSASNPEPFITDSQFNLVKSGDFYSVPWILGCNSEDGVYFVKSVLLSQQKLNNLNKNFDAEAYSHFFMRSSLDDAAIPSVWSQITEYYLPGNHTVTPDNVAKFVEMASDRIIAHSIHKAAQLHLRTGHSPIYVYDLAYHGKYSFTARADYGQGKVDLGVGHRDDLIYLFEQSGFSAVPEDHPDVEVSKALITLWTNFAIYGSPTPSGGDVPQGVIWEPTGTNNSYTLKFGHAAPPTPSSYGIMPLKISLEQDLLKERMDFWDSLPLKENSD